MASASPPPHACARPPGSSSSRTASISTDVVPVGRGPRRTQRRSTSASVVTGWRSSSSATSASAITGKRLAQDELFNRLDVAKDGRVTDLAYHTSDQLGAAVAFNSVLSIPYALDGIEKSLEQ
jgi:hypothetical protein